MSLPSVLFMVFICTAVFGGFLFCLWLNFNPRHCEPREGRSNLRR